MRPQLACIALFALTAAANASPTINVSGSIDGSGIMQINNTSVSWTNTFFGTPTGLTVNGTPWNPSASPSIALTGPLLPTGSLSNYIVNTQVTSGRDIANAQIVNGQLLLYFADTPNGGDTYNAQVSFAPRTASAPSPAATLHIVGSIDGSDTLQISNSGLTWVHDQWGDPSGVTVNGTAWNTVLTPTLPDAGPTSFLPAGTDLSSVVFTKNSGRDTATYQLFPDHVNVYFGDNPVGAGTYDVTLSFGSAPEPCTLSIVVTAIPLLARRRRRA